MEDIGHSRTPGTTDEYGNPINEGGIGGFSTNGTTGYGTGTSTPLSGGGGYGHEGQHHHVGVKGMLHPCDSSSSSEDDAWVGRKEEEEGNNRKDKGEVTRSDQMTSTTPGSYAYNGGHHGQEKKGMMEKSRTIPGNNASFVQVSGCTVQQ